jgi:Zn-dependent M28 family amino/carboxypeptidase
MRVIPTVVAVCVTACTGANGAPLADPVAIRADVTFLASDALEGRGTGSRGYELAGRYVADQMQSIGLAPAGTDGGWRQPLVVRYSAIVASAARVVVTQSGHRIELEPAVDFVALPTFLASAASAQAPLAFVGFGVSAPEFGHDDFAGVDVAGKVAVVIDGVPRSVPPELRDYFRKDKARQLAAHGVVGVVYVTPPAQAAQSPWERIVQATGGGYSLVDGEGRPHDVYPGLEVGIRLSPAATERLFADAAKSLQDVWADAELGNAQAFDLPGSISISTRSEHRTISTFNVVGVLVGSDAALRHEHVVLMAHLDHIGRGAEVDGDSVYNGALDNASGVAVMLEAASMLAATSPRPRRSILFLATGAEELGLLGSRHFATRPTVPRESLVAVVNIDMPVALYPAAGFTAVGAEHSSLGDVARAALAAEGLLSVPSRHPDRGLFTYTDQYSFVREGIPALYIHDIPLSQSRDIDAQHVFEEFLERHYHQRSDETDLPIDWPTLAKLTNVNARVCRDIANAAARPQWLPGSFFGARFGIGSSTAPP